MSWIQALILGLVQGLTEFLPVSSSAHLKLAKKFLGILDGEHLLFFDLICHAGTLMALILYLRRDIWQVLKSPRQIALFSFALAPLVPAYFLLKPLRVAASDPAYLGYFLMVTAALLFMAAQKRVGFAGTIAPLTETVDTLPMQTQRSCEQYEEAIPERAKADEKDRFFEAAASLPMQTQRSCEQYEEAIPERAKADEKDRFFEAAASPTKKYFNVLCIGIAQAFALIPGISRSGSTIAAARFCGWGWLNAARFSFLLAVPTIMGGQLLETVKVLKGNSDAAGVSLSCYAAGFAAAFGLGWLGVRFVFWVYEKEKVRPFAWYCLGVGLLATAIFRYG